MITVQILINGKVIFCRSAVILAKKMLDTIKEP